MRIEEIIDPLGRRVAELWPALLDVEQLQRVLYVGANPGRFHLRGLLQLQRREVHVVEVWPAYVEAVRRRWPALAGVHLGDVRRLAACASVYRHWPFDAVIWWHGPEHVSRADAERLLRPGGDLELWWTEGVLIGCPWGRHEQGIVDGNPHQEHVSTWEEEDFRRWGYHTATHGRRDAHGELAAWRTDQGGGVP